MVRCGTPCTQPWGGGGVKPGPPRPVPRGVLPVMAVAVRGGSDVVPAAGTLEDVDCPSLKEVAEEMPKAKEGALEECRMYNKFKLINYVIFRSSS